jgi:putative hydrolase of the HAD superfamily
MITTVFFDLDDTLIDHTSAIEHAAGDLFGRVVPGGTPSAHQAFVDQWKRLNRDWYQKFYAREVTFQESGRGKLRDAFNPFNLRFSDSRADALLAEYWEQYVSECRLFDDVLPCLSRLSEFQIGVITNGQERQQTEKIRRCGLSAVAIVVTSEQAGYAKPQLEIFQHARDRIGIRAQDGVYIGDSLETDILPANRAGLSVIWLNRAGQNAAHCPPGIPQVNSLNELELRVDGVVGNFDNGRTPERAT